MNKIKQMIREIQEKNIKRVYIPNGDFRRLEEEIKKKMKKETKVCPSCKKKMKNVKDSISNEISKYLFECDCKGMEGKRLSVG